MRPRLSWIWCWIIGAALAAGAGAQQYTTIIDNLPTCTGNRNGRIIAVSDATSDSDCTTGGATGEDRFVHPCICDTLNALGPYWKAVGGGASGSGTIGGTLTATDDLLVCTDGTGGSTIGACTVGNLDNLRLDGNTLSSTDTNGNITLAPNGTGRVVVPLGSVTAPGVAVSGITGTGFTFDEGSQRGVSWTDSNESKFWIGTGDVRMQSDYNIGWTSSSSNASVNVNDTGLARGAAGVVDITDGSTGAGVLHLRSLASPPRTCDGTAEGDFYRDTSHALCYCDGAGWQVLNPLTAGVGTCS